jgi:hypothetical protein
MDGYAELYYRTEADYKVKRNEVLPYAVNCKEYNNIGILVNTLKEAGFSFVLETSGTPSLMTTFLVNLDFKKYYKIPYPVKFECVGDRVYTVDEFLEVVFTPYLESKEEKGLSEVKVSRQKFYSDAAKKMFDYLLSRGANFEISVSRLGMRVLKMDFKEMDWGAIMQALEKVVADDGRCRMDYSKHHGLTEGLPYNLDFVFVKKGKSIHTKESKIAKAFATANDLYGIRFFCYYCGWCVFEITSPPGLLIDPAWPPTYIIVDDLMKARFSEEKESIAIWEQERE